MYGAVREREGLWAEFSTLMHYDTARVLDKLVLLFAVVESSRCNFNTDTVLVHAMHREHMQ